MAEQEQAVGIQCYANQLPGFTAILKHRYADFKVNEVSLEGRLVRLTSLVPPQPQQQAPTDAPAAEAADIELDPAAAVEAAVQQYAAVSGSTNLEPLRAYLQQVQAYHAAVLAAAADSSGATGGRRRAKPSMPPPPPLVLDPLTDKAARTAVHKLFRELSAGGGGFHAMETNTVEAPRGGSVAAPLAHEGEGAEPQDQQAGAAAAPVQQQGGAPQQASRSGKDQQQLQCIQVEVVRGRGGGGGGRGGQGQKRKWRDAGWAGGPERRYVRFVLHKENMDAQQALSSLGKMLRVNHKTFAVAGTKDKRGVTVQQVTAFKVDPSRLAGLNPHLRGMRVGNFEFVADQLRLGDLQGNRFELVLRGVEAGSAEAVTAAAQALRTSGFINYFGLQRFGTGGTPTHRVGQALLRGQWREAVRLLLTPRPDCMRADQVEASRLYLEGGDVEGALRLMPHFLVAEPAVLQGLKQHGPNGFLNALMCVPRNLRTMYIHAYQSYLWNAAASHRVRTYGVSGVVAGDLVMPPAAVAQRSAARNRGQARRQQEGDAVASTPGGEDDAAGEEVVAAEEAEEGGGVGEVHVVTAEEAASGAFSIDDVVLPLPGSQTQLPEHDTADVYRQLAAADGVSLDSSPHGTPDFSMTALAGAYRHVVYRPADLECELVRYSHPDADLALTDLQALQGRTLPPAVAPDDAEGGRYLGLRLAFTLPASCYATMLIRELTKQPTGSEHHKALPQNKQPADGQGGEQQQQQQEAVQADEGQQEQRGEEAEQPAAEEAAAAGQS